MVRSSRQAGPNKPFVMTILCRKEIFHVPIRRRTSDSFYAVGEDKPDELVRQQQPPLPPTRCNSYMITHRRSVAKPDGCFQRRLFVIPSYGSMGILSLLFVCFFMVALCNRADHYIFILFLSSSFFFLLLSSSSFFPRLVSAVGDWMFTILWHMVWP